MVRQRENFLVLMNNYNQVLEAQAIASDSAGLATERYDIYMDGLEATTNRFTAALEQMWMKSIDSDLIKWFIDLGTSILTLINRVNGLIPVLSSLLVVLFAFKFNSVVSGFNSIKASLKAAAVAMKAFKVATVATQAAVTLGVSLIVVAILAIGYAAANNTAKIDKYRSSLDELSGSISSLDSEIKSSRDSIIAIKELGKEFERLDGIIKRTAKEEEEWLKTQRELKTLIPEINGYYDETGNFLFDEGTNLEKLNGLMVIRIRLLNEEREIDRQERLKVEADLLEEQEKALKKAIKNREKFIERMSGISFTPGTFDKEDYDFKLDELDNAIEAARLEVEKTTNSLGFMALGQDDLADAIDDTIPPLDDEANALEELSEAADKASESMMSAMNASTSLLESYEENVALTSSQIEQLKNAFPESYMQALTIEGNLIKLNTEALKEMVITRAKDAISASKAALINISAKRREALSALSAAETILVGNNAIKNALDDTGFAYFKAGVEAVNSANNQIAAQKAILEGSEAQFKSLQDDIKLNEIYLSQLEDGSYWTNELADATGGSSGLSDAQKAYNDLLAITIKMLKQQKEDQRDALKEQLDGYKKIIDARKKLIDLQEDERDYNNELDGKNKELANIDAELLQLQFDSSEWAVARRLELEDQKAKKTEEIDEFQHDRSIELQKSALDQEYDEYKEFIDKKLKIINNYLKKTGQIAQEAMALMTQRTDNFYQSLLNWNSLYGDGIDATISKLWEQASATQAAASSGYNGGLDLGWDASSTRSSANSKNNYTEFVVGGVPNYIHKDTGQSISTQEYQNLPDYHEGGLIGGLPGVQAGEIFAKLMKGEVVVNKQQMQNFMNNTLPNLTTTAGNNETIIHMPITVAGNLDQSILPKIKSIVFDVINQSTSNRGIRRSAKSFSI